MIDTTDPAVITAVGELRTALLRLSLVSHAPIQGYNLAPTELEGRIIEWRVDDLQQQTPHRGITHRSYADTAVPRGGVDHKGDRTPEYPQKSAEHFLRRYSSMFRASRTFTASDIEALTTEAREALDAWQRTPDPAGGALEPERGTFLWKCQIADDDRPIAKLQEVYKPISRRTIERYRARYRGVRRSRRAVG